MVWQSYSSSQELSRSGEGGAKRLLLVFGICQKSTFGVITLADVVNPILYGLCWLSREQASNCQIEEANQEVVTQNDLLLVLLQSILIRKKCSTITLLNRLFCCWIFLIYSLWHCNIRQLIGGKLIGMSIFILLRLYYMCVCGFTLSTSYVAFFFCSLLVYNSRHSERLTLCCFFAGLLSWNDLSCAMSSAAFSL